MHAQLCGNSIIFPESYFIIFLQSTLALRTPRYYGLPLLRTELSPLPGESYRGLTEKDSRYYGLQSTSRGCPLYRELTVLVLWFWSGMCEARIQDYNYNIDSSDREFSFSTTAVAVRGQHFSFCKTNLIRLYFSSFDNHETSALADVRPSLTTNYRLVYNNIHYFYTIRSLVL